MTHVLLPVFVLVRRADTAAVIGAALLARAAGHGHRWIAEDLGRAAGTVRGWLRRFAARLAAVEGFFTAAGVAVAVDPVLADSGGSPWVDAVGAVVWFAGQVADRFGGAAQPGECQDVDARWVWAAASAACGGQLLSPAWPTSPSSPSGSSAS